MAEQLAQRADAPDRDARGPDGWHELAVANPTFLLERLGSECTDLQGLRELTVNGLDAINAAGPVASGRVVWDLDWLRFDASGGRVRKLSVIDTGTGMTAEQLRRYINQLASSGREQSASRQLRRRRQGRRGLPQPPRTRIPLLAPGAWLAGVLQATPRRPLGTRTAALGERPHRLLATTRRAGQAVASARPGSRHPGRAARPARAPRHHPGAGERHRRPAGTGSPATSTPASCASPRRSRCSSASNTTARSPDSCSTSTASNTTSSDTPIAAGVVRAERRDRALVGARRRSSRPPPRSHALGLDRSRRRRARRRALRRAAADPRRLRAPSGLRHPLRLRARRAPPPAPGPRRPPRVQHRPHAAALGPRAAPVGPLGRGVHRRDARRDPRAPGTRRHRRRRPAPSKRSATASARSCRSTASAATAQQTATATIHRSRLPTAPAMGPPAGRRRPDSRRTAPRRPRARCTHSRDAEPVRDGSGSEPASDHADGPLATPTRFWICPTSRGSPRATAPERRGDLEDEAARYHPGRHELTINADFRGDHRPDHPLARPLQGRTRRPGRDRSARAGMVRADPRRGRARRPQLDLERRAARRAALTDLVHRRPAATGTCCTRRCRSGSPRSSERDSPDEWRIAGAPVTPDTLSRGRAGHTRTRQVGHGRPARVTRQAGTALRSAAAHFPCTPPAARNGRTPTTAPNRPTRRLSRSTDAELGDSCCTRRLRLRPFCAPLATFAALAASQNMPISWAFVSRGDRI